MIDIKSLDGIEKLAIMCLYYAQLRSDDPRYANKRCVDMLTLVANRYGMTYSKAKNDRDAFDAMYDNGRKGWTDRPLEKRSKYLYEIYTKYKDETLENMEVAVKEIIAEAKEETLPYFSIKTKDASTVNKILNRDDNIEFGGLNVLQDSMKLGQVVFIVLGGDKPAWDTGLIGMGVISREPYDIGYSGKNYKIAVDIKLLLDQAIKREDLLPYRDTYGTIGIGPITKWEPNQALSQVAEKNAIALMRAMLELCPSIEQDMNSFIDANVMARVKGVTKKMVEIEVPFGTDIKNSVQNTLDSVFADEGVLTEQIFNQFGDKDMENEEYKLKTCLEIEREPRTSRIHPLNFIVYGAPGTGKTFSMVEYALAIVDNMTLEDFRTANTNRKTNVARYKELIKAGQIVFTTFHQNYGYEEFIQGLRPDKDSETMAFKTVDGVFKKISDLALNDTNNNYVIIIDEINRANISKVFGELITLIEEDKRWGELNETSATLQSGDAFAVSNNLYIVGTMNSADKSISLIDAALRRRFDFVEQKPDSSLVADPVLKAIIENINLSLVEELDSTDLLVGHSYFMNKTESDLCNILNNNIIPLLYEYFYDNRKKVASLLNDAIKKSGANVEIIDERVGRLRVKEKVD
jgi:hypothetical protein